MPKIKVKGQTVQTGELGQTHKRMDGRYQFYYLPASRSVNMIYEYYIIGKILYKIERGGGGQAIFYGYTIANLPKPLISSLSALEFSLNDL